MTPAVFIDASPDMQALLAQPQRTKGLAKGLRIHAGDPAPQDLPALIGNAEAVLNGHTSMPAELLKQLPALRRIVFLGSGPASYIDLEAARRLNIEVLRVTGYGDATIAEHAMALMFAVARNIPAHDAGMRAGGWSPRAGLQLTGATLGVIGAGGVGRQMIRLGAGIGMTVLVAARNDPGPDLPASHVPMDQLLAQSDVVSLHLAQTPETIGTIGAAELAAMKPGAILVNTARGALVDEAALCDALTSGHLGGAGLDVFCDEPLPANAPILRAPRTVLTPHTAYNSPQATAALLDSGLRLLAL